MLHVRAMRVLRTIMGRERCDVDEGCNTCTAVRSYPEVQTPND